MAKFRIKIDSILGGISPVMYAGGQGQFQTSIGIDPDQPSDGGDSLKKAGGVITPIAYTDFTSTLHTDTAKWIITNPKDTKVYTYLNDGKFNSYTNLLASETNIGTPTSGAGNGGAYYNNYIYLATPTNVSRYGPLNGTPALTNTVWTGATLGSQTALTNTSYPTFAGISYPNHVMHVHVDDKLYLTDFKDGQGLIHFIRTSKTTDEGDTNNGSTYNALDLPFGWMPTAMCSLGPDLVVAAIRTTDTIARQGNCALFIWDTFSSSFYAQIDIPDAVVTALYNLAGQVFVFHGSRHSGYTVSQYLGGTTLQPIFFSEEGPSPFPGAVDALGYRLAWGHSSTYPETTASVLAKGYKHPSLPRNAIHNIIRTTSAGTDPVVTAVKYAEQQSGPSPRLLVAWNDGTTEGIDKISGSAAEDSIFRSQLFNIGEPFELKKIRLTFSGAIAANQTITPKVLIDDESTTDTLITINNTNFSASQRNVLLYPTKLGRHNFSLQFEFTGTDQNSILLPIIIDGETLED